MDDACQRLDSRDAGRERIHDGRHAQRDADDSAGPQQTDDVERQFAGDDGGLFCAYTVHRLTF